MKRAGKGNRTNRTYYLRKDIRFLMNDKNLRGARAHKVIILLFHLFVRLHLFHIDCVNRELRFPHVFSIAVLFFLQNDLYM